MSSEVHLGPEHGVLLLLTGREGMGSKAGHDLTLEIEDWTCLVRRDDDGELQQVRLVAQVGSLNVVRGDGGLKSLSDKDKATIRKEALKTLQAERYADVVYDADSVVPVGQSLTLTGSVTVTGQTRPLVANVNLGDGGSTQTAGRASILQTDFGIKPYTGMLGALRVRDRVDIHMDLSIPNN